MRLRGMAHGARLQGMTLLELIVVIVLLGILAVGFLAMYGQVTAHNAAGSQTAEMTWVGQGTLEAVLAQPVSNTFKANTGTLCQQLNTAYSIYQVTCTVSSLPNKTVAGTTYYQYQVTVAVTCASGSCAPMSFAAYAYTT